MRKLTTRERLTIDYLPECKWVVKAAGIKAGFSEKYAQHMLPQRVLSNVALKTAYAVKVAEVAEKIDITVESIAAEISNIAFGRITANIGVQGNITNKLKALELLGRFKAMFTDNINQTDTQRQRELDEKEQAEAVRIAEIRLREFKEG